MLNAYFSVQSYDVFTVNWGEDGVRSCQTIHPDLVILDIRLPDIDGYEVARRLRSDRRTADVPIIFLTEKREREDRLQGLELGADDYITKPFDVQELRLRVRNALKRMSQGSLTNPVSGLPEGALVDERLKAVLEKHESAVLLVSFENLDNFREAYGFVASDDVLRAVSMMLQNAVRESEGGDFLGHIGPSEFVLVLDPARLTEMEQRVRGRLEQSVDYFYPIRDREQSKKDPKRLTVKTASMIVKAGSFNAVDKLKMELLRLKH